MIMLTGSAGVNNIDIPKIATTATRQLLVNASTEINSIRLANNMTNGSWNATPNPNGKNRTKLNQSLILG